MKQADGHPADETDDGHPADEEADSGISGRLRWASGRRSSGHRMKTVGHPSG